MTTPITPQQQETILANIRAIVPDRAKNVNDKRQAYMVGAVLALQSIDHNLVPAHWLMNVMANSTDRLFKQPPAKPSNDQNIAE